jgi:hypothetical protein
MLQSPVFIMPSNGTSSAHPFAPALAVRNVRRRSGRPGLARVRRRRWRHSIFATCTHYARQRRNARGRVEVSNWRAGARSRPAAVVAGDPDRRGQRDVRQHTARKSNGTGAGNRARDLALRRAGQSQRRVRRFCQPWRRDVGRHDVETWRAMPQEDLRGDGRCAAHLARRRIRLPLRGVRRRRHDRAEGRPANPSRVSDGVSGDVAAARRRRPGHHGLFHRRQLSPGSRKRRVRAFDARDRHVALVVASHSTDPNDPAFAVLAQRKRRTHEGAANAWST